MGRVTEIDWDAPPPEPLDGQLTFEDLADGDTDPEPARRPPLGFAEEQADIIAATGA
jgi:hypothetical protein